MIIRAHSQLRFQQNKPGAGIIRTGKYRLRELSRSRPVLVLQFSCRGRHRESSVVRLQREGLRSEEHTSELQSRENLVCRLLLEKIKAGPFVTDGVTGLANAYLAVSP